MTACSWVAALLVAVLASAARAQVQEWEGDLCLGCDEDDVQVAKRAAAAVPMSLLAAGMLSRRSALDNNFMRFGRSAPPSRGREPRADNFVRFGRSLVNDEFDRTVRGDPKGNNNGYLRFGRSKDNYMRFGRAKDSFVRFGRAPDLALRPGTAPGSDEEDDDVVRENFLRFGRSVGSGGVPAGSAETAEQSNTTDEVTATRPEKRAAHKAENLMRFGRAKDNYMRFGRDKDNYMRFGRDKDNYMRFGRAKDNYMRFGRAKDNYMRFGRKDDFMRFGRKDDFMRFGRKDDFMRFGRSGDVEDDDAEAREEGASSLGSAHEA